MQDLTIVFSHNVVLLSSMAENNFSLEAQSKSLAGLGSKKAVRAILIILENDKHIYGWTEVTKGISRKDFSYKNEYKPHFIVETIARKIFVIFVSHTYRSDRRKISYYDMEGIKRNSEYAGRITSSIYLIDLDDQGCFETLRERVRKKEQYCPFDNLLMVDELMPFFLEYERSIKGHKEDVKETLDYLNQQDKNKLNFNDYCNAILEEDPGRYGKIGYKYEKFLVNELNKKRNLEQIKERSESSCIEFNEIIRILSSDLNFKLKDINEIRASDSISLLGSGGKSKTDITCLVICGEVSHIATFSVKNTTQSQVSCHERTAEDFIKVLGLEEENTAEDKRLGEYIIGFQKVGSWGALVNECRNFQREEFRSLLYPHRRKLAEWVLKGEHELAENIVSLNQIAEYILLRRFSGQAETIECKNLDEHIKDLMEHEQHQVRDAFSWTYPSGRLGKRIQLKLKLKYFRS